MFRLCCSRIQLFTHRGQVAQHMLGSLLHALASCVHSAEVLHRAAAISGPLMAVVIPTDRHSKKAKRMHQKQWNWPAVAALLAPWTAALLAICATSMLPLTLLQPVQPVWLCAFAVCQPRCHWPQRDCASGIASGCTLACNLQALRCAAAKTVATGVLMEMPGQACCTSRLPSFGVDTRHGCHAFRLTAPVRLPPLSRSGHLNFIVEHADRLTTLFMFTPVQQLLQVLPRLGLVCLQCSRLLPAPCL